MIDYLKYSGIGGIFSVLMISWTDALTTFLMGCIGALGGLIVTLLWNLIKKRFKPKHPPNKYE